MFIRIKVQTIEIIKIKRKTQKPESAIHAQVSFLRNKKTIVKIKLTIEEQPAKTLNTFICLECPKVPN